jgi:EmrB/QacA subfamily drug resistance transporter
MESQQNYTHKWWIFLGGGLMILLVNIDVTIVDLALATIAKAMHTGISRTQWIINAYLLTGMTFFIIGGKLADSYGPKPIFQIGALLFAISSLACGLAPNFAWLIGARLVQGIGFAFTLGLALLIISQSFPQEQRGFTLGLAITITGLGLALGPTVGGAILKLLSWHWIFFINVPIAILSFVIIGGFSQHKSDTPPKHRLDIIGAIWLGLVITTLLLAINSLAQSTPWLTASGILATLGLFYGFYRYERRQKNPIIQFSLFRIHDYRLSILVRFLFMYAYGVVLFFIPLYLQNLLGISPLFTGLILLTFSALFGICSPISGLWCDNSGYKPPIITASALCLLGLLCLSQLTQTTDLHLVLLGLGLFGLGSGIMIPSTVNSTLASLPQSSHGEGIGVFFTTAFMGTSVGVAVSSTQAKWISNRLIDTHQQLLQTLSPTYLTKIQHASTGTYSLKALSKLLSHHDASLLTRFASHSFSRALDSIMWTNVILMAVMLLLSFALKQRKNHE